MEKARRRKKVKVRARPLTKLVILVLLAAIGWQLYGLRSQKLEEKGLEAPGENQLSEMRQASHSK